MLRGRHHRRLRRRTVSEGANRRKRGRGLHRASLSVWDEDGPVARRVQLQPWGHGRVQLGRACDMRHRRAPPDSMCTASLLGIADGHQPTTTPAPTNAKTPSRAPDTPPGAAGGKAAPPLGKLRKAVRPPTQLNEKKAHVKDPNFGNRPRSLHHHRVGGRVWRGQARPRSGFRPGWRRPNRGRRG